MADFPPFAFTTQESWYGELSFKAAEDDSALSLAGRQFEMHITPAQSGAQLVPPVIVLTMEAGRGLSFKVGDPSTLVFRVPKTTANDFPRGEFTGDVLEVVEGERYLFMPVRITYAEPSGLRTFLTRFLGVSVSFAARQQPIYTPLAVPGREGRPGATILRGLVPPVPADGKDGDYFIEDRTTSGQGRRMWGPKAGGAWPGTPWNIQVAAIGDVPGLPAALNEKAPNKDPQFSGAVKADALQILGPGSTGPAGTMSLTPPGGTARTINDRAGDVPSLRDFGGPVGGDWLQPFLNAQAHASKRITVPEGAYPVSFGPFGAASKLYSGPGQIQYPDGTKDAPWRTVVTEYKAPPTGWSPSPTDQWTGDFSQFLTAARSYVTASATPPVSNSYTNMPMASMVRIAMQTDAGFNADPNDHAKGRTGQAMIDLSLRHTGQGDAGVISFNIAVGGTRPGATHFLANPASSMFGGNVYALPGAHGVYLQGSEVVYNDNGESVSAFDRTRNYWRRGNGTDQDQKWIHDRPQVKGEPGHYPIDGFYVPGGPAKRGLDFGSADFGNDGAAIVLSTPPPHGCLRHSVSGRSPPQG